MQTSGAVVVGVDHGCARAAPFRWAASQAHRLKAPLVAVHASDPEALAAQALGDGVAGIDVLVEAEERGIAELRAEVERTGEQLGLPARLETRRGSPARALLEVQTEAGGRVIVVGTGRKGLLREWVLGTTSIAVAAHAACPVAVINPDVDVAGLSRGVVGVGIDGSEQSVVAARTAVRSAAAVGSSVVAVCTWQLEVVDGYVVTEPDTPEWGRVEDDRRALLHRILDQFLEQHPDVPVQLVVRRGPPVDTLTELAAEWDLLVVGSRGLGGFQGRLLGSVSQRLMRRAPCPLLVTRR